MSHNLQTIYDSIMPFAPGVLLRNLRNFQGQLFDRTHPVEYLARAMRTSTRQAST